MINPVGRSTAERVGLVLLVRGSADAASALSVAAQQRPTTHVWTVVLAAERPDAVIVVCRSDRREDASIVDDDDRPVAEPVVRPALAWFRSGPVTGSVIDRIAALGYHGVASDQSAVVAIAHLDALLRRGNPGARPMPTLGRFP